MPKFLFVASYTLEGTKGVQKAGGSSRRDAIAAMAEGLGGKLESFYFAFGEADAYVIIDAPDQRDRRCCERSPSTYAGGATVKTVLLLTPEEIDAAAKRSVDYRPPGA